MSAEKSASKSAPAPLERRIIEHAQVGVPVAVLLGAAIAGYTLGPPSAVLVLASGALIGVIAVFWSSLRTLLGETPLSGADAYALGAPRAEEEQKLAVLRALKDLEFERSVGKISDEDHRELVAKYRAEAKRLLRILEEDAGPRRARVESLVAARLRRAGLEIDEEDGEDGGEAAETAEAVKDELPGGACASCGIVNDEDAVFCKKCGARQPQAADGDVDEDEDDVERDGARRGQS
ncbi:MAG: zinc ribbon domain-containing protein [Polyangiaceae bacterium]|nr:zinc ribbon domain-containing protein [Polyangiaceae bacterium]